MYLTSLLIKVKGNEIWTLCVLIQYANHMFRDLRQ